VTQQTVETAAPAAAPVAASEGNEALSLDQRASLALSQIEESSKAEPTTEETVATEAPAAKPKTEAAAPVVEAAAKTPEQIAEERSARMAAIGQLAEEERARVAASRQRKQERQPAESPAAPPASAGLAVTDAASFWKAAEQLGIPPSDMAAWLSGQSDPVATAKHAAKEALSPVEKKLAELEAKQAAWEQRQQQAYQAAQVEQVVAQNMQILVGHLDTVKAEAPLAAAFKANAPDDFTRAVHSVCDNLPPGFTAQDVIDQLEDNLTKFHKALQHSAPSAPVSTTQRTKQPAAAQANVGNRMAAERATTVEDDDTDVSPDLEDRARQLKARLAAG
jgi:hypothetical protein